MAKILASIWELADNPERNPNDKYRLNNDGFYRALEIYKYRISYYVSRSDPNNPTLLALQSQEQTLITTGSLGKGLQFSTYAFSPGVYIGSGIYDLFIDGKLYNYEPGKPMGVTFDRYDLLPGCLVTGSVDFYYSDKSGVLHHAECSFQLVRG